jgi:hypothetical protein
MKAVTFDSPEAMPGMAMMAAFTAHVKGRINGNVWSLIILLARSSNSVKSLAVQIFP